LVPSSLFALSGRVAVVVGGTSGIGRALALGLADAGADVVAVGRRETLVHELAGQIEERGRRTLRLTADVTDRASLERVRDSCVDQFGQVDILLCAAGVTKRIATLEMDDTDWQNILGTNLTGTMRACQVFGGAMVARGSGRIITVASLSSFLGFFEVAAYTASKSAVAGLTRFGRLDELVGATVFLASDAAGFVTGQLLAVDGGFLASGVNQ
jgi:NAD(P)-dependent dehydrogenase (short-subunit alcohol dehydrogenase family)